MSRIDELRKKLEHLPDTYEPFVSVLISDCERYKRFNPHICEDILAFLGENPEARSSDVLAYELYIIGVPYTNDDGQWFRWDTPISEKEASEIANKEYSE